MIYLDSLDIIVKFLPFDGTCRFILHVFSKHEQRTFSNTSKMFFEQRAVLKYIGYYLNTVNKRTSKKNREIFLAMSNKLKFFIC